MENYVDQDRMDKVHIPSLTEERWRIVDEGDRWVVWFVPRQHPESWRELADFGSEPEAVEFVKAL